MVKMLVYVRQGANGITVVGILANHNVTPDGKTIILQMSRPFKGISFHKLRVAMAMNVVEAASFCCTNVHRFLILNLVDKAKLKLGFRRLFHFIIVNIKANIEGDEVGGIQVATIRTVVNRPLMTSYHKCTGADHLAVGYLL
jgi:hypothetical protein